MQKFKFLSWKVYLDAQDLFSKTILLVNTLPKEYRFELGSQVIRSSLSIVLNIAEGSGKQSDKELNRFIEIALGSAYETLACIDSLYRNKLISKDSFSSIQKQLDEICNQLGGFKKKLLSIPQKT